MKKLKIGYCRVIIIQPDITKVDKSLKDLYFVHPFHELTPKGFPYKNYIDKVNMEQLNLEIDKIYDTEYIIKTGEFIKFTEIKT